jgi:Electron transfer flavoprotein, alpha subunit
LRIFDAPGLAPYPSLPRTGVLVTLFHEEQALIWLMGADVLGRDLGPRVSFGLLSGVTGDCVSLEIGSPED